jgi:O-antigen/teichoic acid export membrane protein
LALSFVACLLANCLLQFGSKQVLGLFGHAYAEQAAWSLRILSLGTFPLIIKNHYVALCRIRNRMGRAILPLAISALLELGMAALGARLGGLSGLSLGWITAVSIEAVFMSYPVYKVVRAKDTSAQVELATQTAMKRAI